MRLASLGVYDVGVVDAGSGSTSSTSVAWSGSAGLSLLGLGLARGFVETHFITIRTRGGATNLPHPGPLGFVRCRS